MIALLSSVFNRFVREMAAKDVTVTNPVIGIKRAYFSDRGRLFQRDRGRRFSAIVDEQGCAQARV